MGALVGDGELKKLTLIKGANDNASHNVQVVKAKTVTNMRKLLRLVVEHGTGGKANVNGYRVGGKTGTAEKVSGGTYKANANLTSFISTFPVDDPKYIMLIMLDEPKGTKATYGFETAGWNTVPVSGKIISRIAPLLGIRPIYDMPGDNLPSPAIEAHNNVRTVSY